MMDSEYDARRRCVKAEQSVHSQLVFVFLLRLLFRVREGRTRLTTFAGKARLHRTRLRWFA